MSQTEAQPPPSPWTAHITPNNNTTITSRRRFQDEQIRCLERMFEEEARPELRVKQQLANRLGLLPRQVAIWFQNKRARSKSKQIEQEYNILKATYDDLITKFEALKKENQSLHIQVQRLRQLSAEYGMKDIKLETDEMPRFVVLETSSGHELCETLTTKNYGEKADYQQEESCALHATQPIDGCFTVAEDSCSFQTDHFLEYQSCNSQWWEL